MVVLSSAFTGNGRTHPFHARRKALKDETGLSLAYLRAIDLAEAAVAVERKGIAPGAVERLLWAELFDAGLVHNEHFRVLTENAGS
jgi:hypothetical protein